jgi:hypothetical protein
MVLAAGRQSAAPACRRKSAIRSGSVSRRISPREDASFAVVAYTSYIPKSSHRYRCSYCQTNEKFGRSPIVLMSDGKLRLIGPDCWHDHFEADEFAAEAAELNLYLRRESFLGIRDDLASELHHYDVALQDCWSLGRGAFMKADQFGVQVGRHMPRLYTELNNVAKAGGRLQVVRKLTAKQRELGREQAPSPRQRTNSEYRAETVATIAGLGLLLPRLSEGAVRGAFSKLVEAQHSDYAIDRGDDLRVAEVELRLLPGGETSLTLGHRIVTLGL